jgi:hypothetical protein
MNPEIVAKFLLEKEITDFRNVDDSEILEYALGERSFENSKFNALIDSSADWASVIAAHIYVDHVLGCFLEEYCVRPRSVSPDSRRLSVADKAAFLHGVGVMSDGALTAINLLNRVRNRFAHRLDFEVTEEQLAEYRSALYSSFGQRFYDRDEFKGTDGGKLGLKMLLKLLVIFVEEERLAYLAHGLHEAKGHARLEHAINVARIALSASRDRTG